MCVWVPTTTLGAARRGKWPIATFFAGGFSVHVAKRQTLIDLRKWMPAPFSASRERIVAGQVAHEKLRPSRQNTATWMPE